MSRYFLSPRSICCTPPTLGSSHNLELHSQKIYKSIYSLRVPESVRTAHGLIYAHGKDAWDFEKVRPISPTLSSTDGCLHSSKEERQKASKQASRLRKIKGFQTVECLKMLQIA